MFCMDWVLNGHCLFPIIMHMKAAMYPFGAQAGTLLRPVRLYVEASSCTVGSKSDTRTAPQLSNESIQVRTWKHWFNTWTWVFCHAVYVFVKSSLEGHEFSDWKYIKNFIILSRLSAKGCFIFSFSTTNFMPWVWGAKLQFRIFLLRTFLNHHHTSF